LSGRGYHQEVIIDGRGGVLEVEGKLRLTIPPRAVSRPTPFRVEELGTVPGIQGVVVLSTIVKLGPVSFWFNDLSATIERMDYAPARAGTPVLFMNDTIVDPQGWVPVPEPICDGWVGGRLHGLSDCYFVVGVEGPAPARRPRDPAGW
jgi:hypothetical protein